LASYIILSLGTTLSSDALIFNPTLSTSQIRAWSVFLLQMKLWTNSIKDGSLY